MKLKSHHAFEMKQNKNRCFLFDAPLVSSAGYSCRRPTWASLGVLGAETKAHLCVLDSVCCINI